MNPCVCGHVEKEHTDGFGRCHAEGDACACLVYESAVVGGLSVTTQEPQR